MKHFFYAVYVLFYSGAVLMAGVFVGQFLERRRLRDERKAGNAGADLYSPARAEGSTGDRKIAVVSRRQV